MRCSDFKCLKRLGGAAPLYSGSDPSSVTIAYSRRVFSDPVVIYLDQMPLPDGDDRDQRRSHVRCFDLLCDLERGNRWVADSAKWCADSNDIQVVPGDISARA